MIVLRFTGGGGVVDRVVRLATWSWASHVDIEMEDGRLLGAVPGRGVCLYEAGGGGRIERYAVEGDAARVIAHARGEIGKPYDWPGVLGWGLRRDWQAADAWFCSELVAWAFAAAGRPLLRTAAAWRVTPRDLLLSPFLIPLDQAADGGRGAATPRTAGLAAA